MQPAHRVHREVRVLNQPQGFKERKELKVRLAQQVRQGQPEQQEHKVRRVRKELLGILVYKGHKVRRVV